MLTDKAAVTEDAAYPCLADTRTKHLAPGLRVNLDLAKCAKFSLKERRSMTMMMGNISSYKVWFTSVAACNERYDGTCNSAWIYAEIQSLNYAICCLFSLTFVFRPIVWEMHPGYCCAVFFVSKAASLGYEHANAPKGIEREHIIRLYRHDVRFQFLINWIAYAY